MALRDDVGTVSWLAVSLILSVALTIALNVALRLCPGAGQRLGQSLERLATPPASSDERDQRRVRVVFPWRFMLVASLVGTLVLNLLLRLRRS